MNVKLGIGFLLTLMFGIAAPAKEIQVRVRLLAKQKQVTLSGVGLHLRELKEGGQLGSLLKMTRKKIELKSFASHRRLTAYGDFLQINNHILIPNGTYLWARPDGFIDVIVELSMEQYLAGVLPSEMPANWPVEALKAQAVASRSYTLSLINERKNWHFDVEATVDDQVFKLANYLQAKSETKKKLDQVLVTTRGQFLSFGNDQFFRAYYHADSGGRTERPQYVWGRGVKLQPSASVRSPRGQTPFNIWEHGVQVSKLESLLRKQFSTQKTLKDLKVVETSPSGRAKKVLVEFVDSNSYNLSAQALRKLVGYRQIKSTQFNIYRKGDIFWFSGRGFGHGVGMCQWGAKAMAQKGLSYRKILDHFYPGTELAELNRKSTHGLQAAANN